MSDARDPQADIRRVYEAAEAELARAAERAVDTEGFAGMLGSATANVAGVTRIATTTFDLALRNLRLAGRRDIVRLATQLNRTEDKLERVLAEMEGLREELAAERAASDGSAPARRNSGGRPSSARAKSASSGGQS
jgi:hypothetical protein